MAEDRSSVDVIRESKLLAYTVGAFTLAAGVTLLLSANSGRFLIAKLIGIILLFVGFGDVIESIRFHRGKPYWGLLLFRGVINIGFGAALVFWPKPSIMVIVWLIGLDFVLAGILGLVVRGQLPDEMKTGTLTRSLVTIGFGVAIMLWPDVAAKVVALVIGGSLILTGLVFLWSGHAVGKLAKEAKSA